MGNAGNQPATITSSLQVQRSSESSILTGIKGDKQKAQTIILLLSRLAVHHYRPEFTEAMSKSIIQDMVGDLVEFTVPDIEKAIETYRRMAFAPGKFKPFPDSGMLRKLANDERRHREDMAKRPALKAQWNGARPSRWWQQPRQIWQPHWRESEVPADEFVRDPDTGKLRKPEGL